jgi:hypothetical protein
MQQPKLSARILAQDGDHCLAVWHRTGFAIFRGPATIESVTGLSRLCLSLAGDAEREGRRATYLSVIERSSPPPIQSVRHELALWSRDVVPQMAVAVMVAEGGGFKNALVRAVGVTLTVLAPHKVPFKFAASVAEAAVLVEPFIARGAGGAAELALAIADVRARCFPDEDGPRGEQRPAQPGPQ